LDIEWLAYELAIEREVRSGEAQMRRAGRRES
jgi:hypothetical protein